MPKSKLDELCEQLGYEFQNSHLLETALTHRSFNLPNNERLEFLGDSIVNYVIAEALYHRCPEAREGTLSRLRASLVRGETLAELAREFNLGHYLRLGTGEVKTGGQERTSILADAMEAVIAAIYLDGGMDACRARVEAWFAERMDDPELSVNLKDPKTLLQEWLQSQKLPLPKYQVTEIMGAAHNQTFKVTCVVRGLPHVTEGVGTSRRRAEQEAASHYLAHVL